MEKEMLGELDVEWVQLIKEALDLGMKKEDIRSFLAKEQPQQLVLDK